MKHWQLVQLNKLPCPPIAIPIDYLSIWHHGLLRIAGSIGQHINQPPELWVEPPRRPSMPFVSINRCAGRHNQFLLPNSLICLNISQGNFGNGLITTLVIPLPLLLSNLLSIARGCIIIHYYLLTLLHHHHSLTYHPSHQGRCYQCYNNTLRGRSLVVYALSHPRCFHICVGKRLSPLLHLLINVLRRTALQKG